MCIFLPLFHFTPSLYLHLVIGRIFHSLVCNNSVPYNLFYYIFVVSFIILPSSGSLQMQNIGRSSCVGFFVALFLECSGKGDILTFVKHFSLVQHCSSWIVCSTYGGCKSTGENTTVTQATLPLHMSVLCSHQYWQVHLQWNCKQMNSYRYCLSENHCILVYTVGCQLGHKPTHDLFKNHEESSSRSSTTPR